MHAPGHVHPSDHWRVGHHVLLAHAAAVQRFRHLVPNGRISLNANTDYAEPLTDSQEDKVCCLSLVAGVKDLLGGCQIPSAAPHELKQGLMHICLGGTEEH